jgi:LAO/AO transport system kinase
MGVTGAPGTGKSTLVDRLAAHYRAAETRGNYRRRSHQPVYRRRNPGRSHSDAGTRERCGHFYSLDGDARISGRLARTTGDVALVLDAAGKQFVLVETVGVGQDEVDIVRLADCTLVLLVPGLGDDVQSMKAGLMEIADIFVLNKSDREGATAWKRNWKRCCSLLPSATDGSRRIVRTVATENKGVDEVAAAIEKYREHFDRSAERAGEENRALEAPPSRLGGRNYFWSARFRARRAKPPRPRWRAKSRTRRKDPYAAVRELLARADGRASDETGRPGILAAHRRHIPARRRSDVRRDPQADVGARFAADGRNRILMAMNSLLIRAAGKWILVETGAGDKWDAKRSDIYAFEGPPRLPEKLVTHGVPPEKIDIVINTHLHFDHCGWNTRVVNGKAVPVFPNARYIVQRGELEHAKESQRSRPGQLFP